MTTAPVSVVIVAWNARRWLSECLDSLAAQTLPPAEVLVVDNASADGAAALVSGRYPEVRLWVARDNLGFCVANNRGFEATRQPYVLALNPDTRLAPTFLEELLPAMEDPAVGIACGKLLRFDGRTIDSAGQELGRSRQPIDRGYGTADDGRFDRDEAVFGACGAGALYRREMLEAVADPDGAFDPSFFAFNEDLDLAWRARKLGWRTVYRHRAVGQHARGGSADRAHPLARYASILSRNPTVQFHILKNRWLTILRNDRPADFLRNLPWIALRDLAQLPLLMRRPSLAWRLWRARGLARRALRKRRLDARRPRHQVQNGNVAAIALRSSGSG